MPNHLSWLLSMQRSSGSSPSLPWMSELLTLISKVESRHSPELTHFGHLYSSYHCFGHYSKLMTIGEGWDVDLPVNSGSAPSSPRQSGVIPASLLMLHRSTILVYKYKKNKVIIYHKLYCIGNKNPISHKYTNQYHSSLRMCQPKVKSKPVHLGGVQSAD